MEKERVYHFERSRGSIRIPLSAIEDCTMRECDATSAVNHWVNREEVDWSESTPEEIREELEEVGAWEDLEDPTENRKRLLWIACHSIKEEEEQC